MDDSLSTRHPLLLSSHWEPGQSCGITVSSYSSYIHHCSSVNSITLVHLWTWWRCALLFCFTVLSQAKNSLKLRQQPWDKKGWRVIIILATYSQSSRRRQWRRWWWPWFVCSLSCITFLSETRLTVHTPIFLWHYCGIGMSLADKGKACSCMRSIYGKHAVCFGQKVTCATRHLCVACEF